MFATSTAEAVATMRLALSHQGVLNESMSAMFYPEKAEWIKGNLDALITGAVPGGLSHRT